jgi:hypothetical protein
MVAAETIERQAMATATLLRLDQDSLIAQR